MTDELKKKVEQAIKFLQVCYKSAGEPLEIAYSGGKDSDVILELAKMAGIPYRAIYKNTTIDYPGTIKHVKDNNAEIMRPKTSFFGILRKNGFPTGFHRFCCYQLKEYKVLDNCVIGVRKEESIRRKKRYSEPTECKFYGRAKKNHVNAIYPILDWTLDDEKEFIQERGIQLHPIYYKEDGSMDLTRRVGCMCCPALDRKKRIDMFKKYPQMVVLWIRNGKKYYDSHPKLKSAVYFKNVYERFVCNVFFETYEKFRKALGGMFGEVDCKKWIENYFNVKLD